MIAAGDPAFGPTLALIIGVGMAAQWIAWRTQIPSIILLLLSGLLLGPGLDLVQPDELLGEALFPLVSIAVALILFEGGLDLPPRELRATGTVVRRLISLGALITLAIAMWASLQLFDISRGAAFVLGAVVIVTGPTVVGPLLRFVRPSGRSGPILRAEGILIDPIGATIALIAFEVALAGQPDEAITSVLEVVARTLIGGFGIGFLVAVVLDLALRRFLIPDHLGNPMVLAVVVVGFVLADQVQEESGLLAVTVTGMYLARQESAAVRQLLDFNESLRTLLISLLFILLAARIETGDLGDVALPAIAFIAILVLVARPLMVIASTVRTALTWRERVFLMAMAPRGIVAAAVSAIFALRLEDEGVRGAEVIVPVTFLVVIGTIVIYGVIAGPAARALGLAERRAAGVLIVGAHAVGRGLAKQLDQHDVKSLLVDTDPYDVTRAIAAGLRARRLSVLTDDATNELDLSGIGRIVALTSNDEVNALASSRFSRVFGRRETFQLAPAKHRRTTSIPEDMLGRVIGIDGLSYRDLEDALRSGWSVASTTGGSDAAAATDAGSFVPIARIFDRQLGFICRNDPVPEQGVVIGLASPAYSQRLAEAT